MHSGAARFRRLRWASVIGALGVVIAGAGLLGAAQDFFLPTMLEVQRGMLDEMAEAQRQRAQSPQEEPDGGEDKPFFLAPETVEALGKFTDLPTWYPTWAYTTGTARLAISTLYLCASILLLTFHIAGIRLLITAAGAAIVWNVVRCVVASSAGTVAALMTFPHAVMGSIFHVVLIGFVVRGARTIEPADVETTASADRDTPVVVGSIG